MPDQLAYSGTPLDRASTLRNNDRWLLKQAEASPKVLAVWRDKNLIDEIGPSLNTPRAAVLTDVVAREILNYKGVLAESIFLGMQGGEPVFAADFSDLDEDEALATVSADSDNTTGFTDLRTVGPLLSQHEGSLLAFARGMAYWHRRHRFCGTCGAETLSKSGGFMRTCSNSECDLDHFPRTDPAVIMLVTADLTDGEHCLLGRQPSWADGLYSSLAGFVEPGESLETAVAREVMEESSIAITDVQYRASQPWPFPSSLMLGFRAKAVTFDIDVGDDELEDARWFSRSDLHERALKDEADGKLSRSDSIARWLIEDWMNE